MKIERLIVPDSVSNKVSFGRGNPKNYLTIHQTGNTDPKSNAMAHHNLQARAGVGYGWHWQVDDEFAIQTHDHSFKIWNAGDGRGKGNTESISIEICVNSDGDYNQSVENGAKLAAMILKEENIDISKMVQHNHWSGKDCPHEIRAGKNGITWTVFVEKVRGYLNGIKKVGDDEEVENISIRKVVLNDRAIDNLPNFCADRNNVGNTVNYIGFVVTLTKKWNDYYYSQYLNGWVHESAFEDIIECNFRAVVKNKGYSVDNLAWTKRENKWYKHITSSDELLGKEFTITARTQEEGGYYYIHELAKWIDNRAFE